MYSLTHEARITIHFILIVCIYSFYGWTANYEGVNFLYNKIGPKNSISDENGCPTFFGTFILGLLFSLTYIGYYDSMLNTFPMRGGNRYSLFITCLVLFMFFSNKYTYKNINKFFNKTLGLRFDISTPSGCPTIGGTFFHGFLLALFGFMFPIFLNLRRIPKK